MLYWYQEMCKHFHVHASFGCATIPLQKMFFFATISSFSGRSQVYVISCIPTDRQDRWLIFSSVRFPFKGITIRLNSKALVYDILPPTTAITDYVIGLGKLSAKGQV